MGMDIWIWLILAVVFLVAEAATTALISVWFAVGAFAAMITGIFTDSIPVQIVVFAAVSAVTLGAMMPLLIRRRRQRPPVTNGSGLVLGKHGVVIRAILPGEVGRVRVDGLDWQARSDTALPQGSRCRVTGAQGALLTVDRVEQPQPQPQP